MSHGASPSRPCTKNAIPIPKKARPVAHRVMRSKNLSDNGRFLEGSSTPRHNSVSNGHATAPFIYEGEIRSQILRLKYANQRSIARELGHYLVVHIQQHIGTVGMVTWAPTVGSRRRKRGVDQAELLARHVGRELGVPCHELLIRVNTESQTGKSRAERLVHPQFRARALQNTMSVVIIDDVITTGATLRAAALALRRVGVSDVYCVAVAKTRGHRSLKVAPVDVSER